MIRSRTIAALLLPLATLTACSSIQRDAASCAELDPIALSAAPLTKATSISLTTNDTAGAPSDATVPATITIRRDARGSVDARLENLPPSASSQFAAIALVDGSLFVKRSLPAGIVPWEEASADDRATRELAESLSGSIDAAITGESSIVPGIYQLGDTLASSFSSWREWPASRSTEGSSCVAEYVDPTDARSVVRVTLDISSRITRFAYANKLVTADLRVGYDAISIERPAGATPPTTALESEPRELEAELTALAGVVDRESRSAAAQSGLSPASREALEPALTDSLPDGVIARVFGEQGAVAVLNSGVPTSDPVTLPSRTRVVELERDGVVVCLTPSSSPAVPAKIAAGSCTW